MSDTAYTPPPVPSTSRWNGGGASSGGGARSKGAFAGARDSVARDAGNVRDQLVGGFGKVVDAAEGQLHRVPDNLQPAARKAVAFSRERPLATMAGLAALALVLTSGARRR